MSFKTRWMYRCDLPAVAKIEEASFPKHTAKTADDFLAELTHKHCIGVVAEQKRVIVGYMVYELYRDYIQLTRLAAHPCCRLLGVGRSLVQRLMRHTSQRRRGKIKVEFPESDVLTTGDFFRRQRFRGVGTKLDLWDGHNILMEYTAPVPVELDLTAILTADFTPKKAAA